MIISTIQSILPAMRSLPPKSRRRLALVFCALLGVVLLFMIAGGIRVQNNLQTVIFHTPMFILLMALLGGATLLCLLTDRPGLSTMARQIIHAGFVVLMIGSAVTYFTGLQSQFVMPVTWRQPISQLQTTDGRTHRLPATFQLLDFKHTLYPPRYLLCTAGRASDDEMQLQVIEQLSPPTHGSLQIPGLPDQPVQSLKDQHNQWRRLIQLPDGRYLKAMPAKTRDYRAHLLVQSTGAKPRRHELAVNQPLTLGWWYIYLVDYNRQQQTLGITAWYDPGRPIVRAGLWLMLIGTIAMLLIPASRRSADA